MGWSPKGNHPRARTWAGSGGLQDSPDPVGSVRTCVLTIQFASVSSKLFSIFVSGHMKSCCPALSRAFPCSVTLQGWMSQLLWAMLAGFGAGHQTRVRSAWRAQSGECYKDRGAQIPHLHIRQGNGEKRGQQREVKVNPHPCCSPRAMALSNSWHGLRSCFRLSRILWVPRPQPPRRLSAVLACGAALLPAAAALLGVSGACELMWHFEYINNSWDKSRDKFPDITLGLTLALGSTGSLSMTHVLARAKVKNESAPGFSAGEINSLWDLWYCR